MKWRWQLACLLCPIILAAENHSRGVSECAPCHSQAKSQPSTSMGRALETAEECKVLIDHPVLTTKQGQYSYRIERKGNQSSYTVSDGAHQLTVPVKWAMGASSAIGQTYILEKGGELYESRVSYFSELKGLGPTIGSENFPPRNLDEAVGRVMGAEDKLKCFGCHSTNARMGTKLTLEKLLPGVRCVHCHETSGDHFAVPLRISGAAASLAANTKSAVSITVNSKRPSAEDVSNFCGQCHRTWEEIALSGRLDISNIRFQPYRLAGSKCYDEEDPRISCLACHDPHQELNGKQADYDSKCQACHGGGKVGARACKVSTQNCVSCHMPKLELPGAHHRFADHRIRIVKPNEKYPG